jgi:hypothetical protein
MMRGQVGGFSAMTVTKWLHFRGWRNPAHFFDRQIYSLVAWKALSAEFIMARAFLGL